ncbi:MAG: type 1 glutamine amidotransferase, partial [Rhodobacteraceae bacterium]|nr:type 1 glutamine amidotransferase [Paracoccaceae bacterium]
MHIAILDSNTDDSAFAQRHDTETEKFRKLLGRHRPDWQFTEVDVVAGDLPDGPDAFDGYIVTGSPASVNDPHPWVACLLEFIRRTASDQIPIYGTCFGHQAIAKALGGTVEKNPQGWEFGRIDTVLTQPWDGATLPLSL